MGHSHEGDVMSSQRREKTSRLPQPSQRRSPALTREIGEPSDSCESHNSFLLTGGLHTLTDGHRPQNPRRATREECSIFSALVNRLRDGYLKAVQKHRDPSRSCLSRTDLCRQDLADDQTLLWMMYHGHVD